MHVAYTQSKLSHDFLALLLAHSLILLLLQVVEERHAWAAFHHQVHLSSLVDHLVQTHYIWVIHLRECRDLVVHSLLGLIKFKVLFFICLKSYDCFRFFVDSPTYLCKSSLPNLQTHLELLQI